MITYQGVVSKGQVSLPTTIQLPEGVTVLVTVLDDKTLIESQSQESRYQYVQTQTRILQETRALRERMQIAGEMTDSTKALEQVREERTDDLGRR